jgi:hypothetical protein
MRLAAQSYFIEVQGGRLLTVILIVVPLGSNLNRVVLLEATASQVVLLHQQLLLKICGLGCSSKVLK